MENAAHINLFVVLLMVAAVVAMTVKWIKLPYSIALVITGLAIGVFHLLPPVEMTPELILLVFLPALLFEASWNIELKELKETWLPVTVLATTGVFITMLIVAFFMKNFAAVALGPAFLFGAMIAATDPISVLALFRKLGMDRRLTMILEGESLFNDGTAVVVFKLVLAVVLAGSQISIETSVGQFLIVVLGGAVIGSFLGFMASKITFFFEDHLLEITLTTILAYGSFLLAEALHVSPVISVVAAGIVMGNYGSRTAMSPTTRLAVNSFWEYTAFVVNSMVFLLIGLQVKFDLLSKYGLQIGVGIAAVLVARAVVVYGLCPFIQSKQHPIPFKWQHLLFWGALRGSLCMALALSIPANFEYREMIIITTFGVVLFTLLVPGLIIEPLVKFLKMAGESSELEVYRKLKAQLTAKKKALEYLSLQLGRGAISPSTDEHLRDSLQSQIAALTLRLEGLHIAEESVQTLEESELRKNIFDLERDCIKALSREGHLSEQSAQEINLELTEELEKSEVPDSHT